MYLIVVNTAQQNGHEIRKWILENSENNYRQKYRRVTFDGVTYGYVFRDEEDAFAFKMAWS